METPQQILFIISAAGTAASLAYLLLALLLDREKKRISQRLSGNAPVRPTIASKTPHRSVFKRLAESAAKPFMPDQGERITGMRAQLAMAGIYDPAAFRLFVGYKFILLFVGVLGGYFVGMLFDQAILGLSLGGIAGYLGPQLWIKLRIKANQRELNVGLPDALDLMVICVEAGLTIDAALQRVGDELAIAHPAISREFAIAHAETRLGVSRQDAFKNLAGRTGNVALQSLAAMLIQADKFGTSIGQALRVQAEAMRVKRQLAAEELAAKASVKMTFPLVLFIFPATFVVIGGPMAIELMNSALFAN